MDAVEQQPPKREVLHESPHVNESLGRPSLQIWRNPHNRFVVVSLLYSADPAKRTPEWLAEARAGMTQANWEKEYELNYNALFGEKVFPEIYTRRDEIVIPSTVVSARESAERGIRFYAGFDYGPRSPSSLHVYMVEQPKDAPKSITAIWELYEPCENYVEFATRIRACPYYPWLQWIAADPSIWFTTQQAKQLSSTTSVWQLFANEGIDKFVKGVRDESSWVAFMREHWASSPVTFRIMDCCPKLVDEFQTAVYADPKMVDYNRPVEDRIADVHNHALDDCKYFRNTLGTVSTQQRRVKYPIMSKRWSK